MNCGRDPRPLESFLRSAAEMPNAVCLTSYSRPPALPNNIVIIRPVPYIILQPTTVFMASGTPVWSPKECANMTRNEVNRRLTADSTTDEGHDEVTSMVARIKSAANASHYLTTANFLRKATPNGVVLLAQLYSSMAPMGQSVLPVEVFKCRGPYNANFSIKSTGETVECVSLYPCLFFT